MLINNDKMPESYLAHHVFDDIEYMRDFYDRLSDRCFYFIPSGTHGITNYASYIYMSYRGTLKSIKMLLENGIINDALVLVRKLYDDVLVDIYIDVLRKDRFDLDKNFIVEDVDNWINSKHRIPSLKKILKYLEKSPKSKDLYPFFGWDTYLKHNREILDDSVHSNRFTRILLNCSTVYIKDREKHLDGIAVILKQIFTIHLAFTFYMNEQYLMASDYMDSIDCGINPPDGSQSWIAPYAQEAFDKYIAPRKDLSTFIIEHSCLDIASNR